MTHFDCAPFSGNPLVTPLVFDWDEVAGTVSGPDAAYIQQIAQAGSVPLHPMPNRHDLSNAPLKNRSDMAAIIGYQHRLPAELADAYPYVPESPASVEALDADGRVIDVQPVIY